MAHLPHLITDLSLILAAAAFITLVFKWLKQPLVLGYIIAGFLVGPYFKWLPTITEIENINIWAEVGVIFLLFSLGLEFSFKKLVKVGGSASVTALIEVVFMVAAGYGVGRIMGWSSVDSLFLGGILSISSTTIIIRAFEELGFKTKHFASLVFGVLIIEDLVAIVLMVLLSTMAVSRQFAGSEMIYSMMKLVSFIAIWFLMGIFLIPTFLKKIKNLISDEMLLIISLALCLLMVVFADYVGFSPALGAFVMGSLLAETTKAEKIEHLVKPVKDLFGAIFFVSVGMLINPAVLVEYAVPVIVLCIATIIGKIFSTSLGALVSGQTLQNSIQAGFSLAQIGEFSFIIATLGLTLKVTSEFLYPVTVAVSAVTTFTTPYLIKSSTGFYQWLNTRLPQTITKKLNRYSSETGKVTHAPEWNRFVRSAIINFVLTSVVILSIIVISAEYIRPWIEENGNSLIAKIATLFFTLLILAPFLWALAIRTFPIRKFKMIAPARHSPGLLYVIRLFKLFLAAFFIALLLQRFFNFYVGIILAVLIMSLLIMFSKNIQAFYTSLQRRFFDNLNQREIAKAKRIRAELAPWDAHIAPLVVLPNAPCVGKKLSQLKWRESIGINIVMIKRGELHIAAPGRDEVIFPHDELLVLGTDGQIQRLKVLMRPLQEAEPSLTEITDVELYQYRVTENSTLVNSTIRDTGLREKANALVVGVERNNSRILNPESDFILATNDILSIVGNRKKLRTLLSEKETKKL